MWPFFESKSGNKRVCREDGWRLENLCMEFYPFILMLNGSVPMHAAQDRVFSTGGSGTCIHTTAENMKCIGEDISERK